MESLTQTTVAGYLLLRLKELGLTHLFGIAGNYSAPFLNTIDEDQSQDKIKIIGDTNEINAGHCADAYARLKGFAAVAVTYGVGAFTLLNATAGSYVEHCPVLVINGSPTNADQMKSIGEGLLASHMTGDMYSNINVYRHVTVAAELVMSSIDAPYKIDAVLTACLIYGRPVYLEVFEDVWRMPCEAPKHSLVIKGYKSCVQNAVEAAKKTVELIKEFGAPIFWAGEEIQRKGLQDDFLKLVKETKIEFTTSIMGKSIVSESNPYFRGVFNGNASPKDVQERFKKAGVKIGLGAWTTGKNLGGFNIWGEHTVLANHSSVRIGAQFEPNVALGDFMIELNRQLKGIEYEPHHMYEKKVTNTTFVVEPSKAERELPLTFDSFFGRMNKYITEDHLVVSDAGFALLGAQGLHIKEPNGFVAQASWLSIGYSVPAAVGVKCAVPEKQVVVFVGDGAFQETCQAISNQARLGHNTIVFVLDNTIYGIEQMLTNPNPFRGSKKIHYEVENMNEVYPYNKMHQWKYAKLADVFGGKGFEVSTMPELEAVIKQLDTKNTNFIVHVHLPEVGIPEAIAYKNDRPGEDEILNKGWSLCG
ncbi:alpha-keto acid decarboxylase family protein [Mucilaginibacter sp. KACC 22063]|uniref:alpha-keto acid decarboxylase family protein n=1 Tax=Mucilaginibacter sp. KACC 22063 TaxID=3025666 RepID=UPI0023673EE7|nr:thiamine pyrophosphate-dependent enzyme [Mucilaginibacter sp. KACC 22063]WDF57166.1 thiamine pyrophosphate-binding protein [Mucilaginibacter sp. KACC 22063]